MKNKIIKLLFISTMLYSCDKLNLETADANIPVVESYLNPKEEISVKIVKQLSYNAGDTVSAYLEDLDVLLSDETNTYKLSYTDSGIYTNPEVNISPLVEYSLEFSYNNKTIKAETIIPEKPLDFSSSSSKIEIFSFADFTPGSSTPPERPAPITLSWTNTNADYHMIVVECIDENSSLINASTNLPPRLFRNTPTINSSQELDQKNFSYYGNHRLILYKLNADYAALYEQLGTSSLDITAPPSNVENGLGIFTGINSDTLYLNVLSQ